MTTFVALAAALALAAPTLPPPGVVDGPTAKQLIASGATVIDVRTPGEFEGGHIAGARLIPFDQMASRAAEVGPKDKPVVLYCRTGRRTALAATTLRELGFKAVYDMQGLNNWPGEVVAGPR